MPRPRLWKPFILAASYVFYAAASWRFCAAAGGVTLANQAGAVLDRPRPRRAPAQADPGRRRWRSTSACSGVFKYYGFFAQDVDRRARRRRARRCRCRCSRSRCRSALSFFTFQAISYVVDVKRRLVAPGATIDVAIYLSFFPHLVAGPIVRAREFLPAARDAARPARRRRRRRRRADRDRAGQEGRDRRLPRAHGRRPRVRRARRPTARPTSGWPPTPTRRRSTATSPATPTSRSALALLMGFVFPQNFNRALPRRRASATSGAAGT